ncbi:MAG TPA: MFS transporter [Pyrinomonadaceae bacterium]|jgi:MFS family permease|nr:MFS transporter [Pyrinomonadaceae bacterium]
MFVDITPLKISRDYRLLFFGQMVSFFGVMMTVVVVPWQMYQLTQSNFQVGLIYLFQFVPMIVMAFVGGALADAVDRRKMLRITEVMQTLVTAALLVNSLLPQPQVWVLYVCVVLHAAFMALQRPAFDSLIPVIVPPEYMTAVGALNSLRYTLGAILSFSISGIIANQLGAPVAYAIDLVTFAATLIAVWKINAVPPPPGADRPSLKTVIEGFRYAVSRQDLIGTYLIDINAMLFGMPMALFPALGAIYGGNSVGLFYAAFPLGALIASITSGWTSKKARHGLLITIAAGLWGVAIIFFGLMDSLWLSLLFLTAAGFFDMISGIFRGAIWNQTIPNHLRGRLAGIEMISYLTGPMLGNAASGILASYTSVKFSIISGGVLTVIGTIILALLLPKFIRYHSSEGLKRKELEESERNSRITNQALVDEDRRFSEDSY